MKSSLTVGWRFFYVWKYQQESFLYTLNRKEIDSCFEHLVGEIQAMSPKIVFLLGEKVYSSVGKHLKINFEKWDEFEYHYKKYEGTYYVPIHHPSYIYVYKRKRMDEYIVIDLLK